MRAILSFRRRCIDYISDDATVWEQDPIEDTCAGRSASRPLPSRVLAADGYAARQEPSRRLVERGQRTVEGLAVNSGLLAKPPRAGNRSHRIQGQLARAVAESTRRERCPVTRCSADGAQTLRTRRNGRAHHSAFGIRDVRDLDRHEARLHEFATGNCLSLGSTVLGARIVSLTDRHARDQRHGTANVLEAVESVGHACARSSS